MRTTAAICKNATRVKEMNRPIIDLLRETLERGTADGIFRKGLDPLHIYLSIAGMAFFYFANIHTLSRIFSRPSGGRGGRGAARPYRRFRAQRHPGSR